jgi:hypothetical protein
MLVSKNELYSYIDLYIFGLLIKITLYDLPHVI